MDIEVNKTTGQVRVLKVVVGRDSGLVINPAGVRLQLHGNVVQSVSRILNEQVQFDEHGVTSFEWGSYPILKFPDIPEIDPATPDVGEFTESEISKGEHIAAAGMCVVCHTKESGECNAGGHTMETPFGTIYMANITPDPERESGSGLLRRLSMRCAAV